MRSKSELDIGTNVFEKNNLLKVFIYIMNFIVNEYTY